MNEEFDNDADYRSPATLKLDYRSPFLNLSGRLDAYPELDFYAAAQAIVLRLANRETIAEIEAMAALYLFRHYLEVMLKNIAFGARSLETRERNAAADTVEWPRGHNLVKLWQEVKIEVPRKLGKDIWESWDYQFVEGCIREFHLLDPSGVRLRYRCETNNDSRNTLQTDWNVLLEVMHHDKDVLEHIDSWLFETHAQNQDWEDEKQSWM